MFRTINVVVACVVLAGCTMTPPRSEFHCTDVSPAHAQRTIRELNEGRGSLYSHYDELTACLDGAQVSGPWKLSAADYQRYFDEIHKRVPVRKDHARVSEARQRFEETLRAHWHKTTLHRLDQLLTPVETYKPGVLSLNDLDNYEAEVHKLLSQIQASSAADFVSYSERAEKAFSAARAAYPEEEEIVASPGCRKRAAATGLPSVLEAQLIVAVYNSNIVASNFARFVCGMAQFNSTVQYVGTRAPKRHGFRNQDGAVVWLEKGNYRPLADIDAWVPVTMTDNGIERRLSPEDVLAIMLAFE